MANIQQRAGSVRIRVGGNTQEVAKLVDQLPENRILQKNLTGIFGTTNTPPLDFTRELLYMMGNISSLVNVGWFLGVPWFVTKPFDLTIVPAAVDILGDHLLGLQAANEPDLYVRHQHRIAPYTPFDYYGEMSDFLTQLAASGLDTTGRAKQLLVAPNIAWGADWTPDQIWATGLVDTYNDNLAFLAMERSAFYPSFFALDLPGHAPRYPESNCGAAVHDGEKILDPQTEFPNFLSHDISVNLLGPYINSTAFAQTKGKRLLMMETNSVRFHLRLSHQFLM
jgi:hypothetical protein